MFTYRISEITFSGGETIALEANALIILIGPNNSGKSRTLRDIVQPLRQEGNLEGVVVTNVKTVVDDILSLRDWLESGYPATDHSGKRLFSTTSQHIEEARLDQIELVTVTDQPIHDQVSRQQQLQQRFIKDIGWFLVHFLDAEQRLSIVKPVQSISLYSDPPQQYIHFLQTNGDLLASVSKEVRQAFGVDLIPDWGASSKVGFYVGEEPPYDGDDDRVSRRYLEALRKLPMLAVEGDGIKSFVGCLLAVKVGAHKILVIDEPEAFLHPPQARRLGRILADSARDQQRQIIIATHSSDVIRGAISSTANVAVCRIERDGDQNHAHLLNSAELKDLWSKPLLRSSGAVEGVFHTGVVVCESDSDARFYESLLLRSERTGNFVSPVDFHFIHGGGKGELATLARSYNRLRVPVVVIADFDILKNVDELRILVRAMGGDFTIVEVLYNSVSGALAQMPPSSSKETTISEVRRLLNEFESDDEKKTLTGGDKEKISDLLNDARDWSEPKKYGIQKLQGGTYQDCQQLLSRLNELGIFVVPKGELESWNRGLSATKTVWIREALELMDDDPASFEEASAFLNEIAAFLGISLRNGAAPKP